MYVPQCCINTWNHSGNESHNVSGNTYVQSINISGILPQHQSLH